MDGLLRGGEVNIVMGAMVFGGSSNASGVAREQPEGAFQGRTHASAIMFMFFILTHQHKAANLISLYFYF